MLTRNLNLPSLNLVRANREYKLSLRESFPTRPFACSNQLGHWHLFLNFA